MTKVTASPMVEWSTRPIPEKLWHYTSLQGFLGIVSNKNIFATNLRFLNDREEFIHGLKIAQNMIAEIEEFDSNGWSQRAEIKQLTDWFFAGALSPAHLQVFVASFSTAEDQLSQWRAYSQASVGVSLGFDLRNIRPDPKIDSLVVFAECIYDESKKKELISGTIKNFAEKASALWKLTTNQGQTQQLHQVSRSLQAEIGMQLNLSALQFSRDLFALCALMKHSSFLEEREWRLVLPVTVATDPKSTVRKFRTGTSTLVPYLEFNLAEKSEMPLTDIILGPGSEPETSVEAAQTLLQSERFTVLPRTSKAPFRTR